MNLLDLIFPPRCAGCGRHGSTWCPPCAASVVRVAGAVLGGVPLVAGGWFGGQLQAAIHTYKYRGRPALATALVPYLLRAVQASRLSPTALTFVPLHPQRQAERGFNQAERLARILGEQLAIPVIDGLVRTRATPAQVGLSQAERRHNLVAAFEWPGQPVPAGLAVVDDVCTTGATLTAAAEAVRAAGGSVGSFLVLARAQTLPLPAVALPEQCVCS